MSRREERQQERRFEALVKGIGMLFLLISVAIGGLSNFGAVLISLIYCAIGVAVISGIGYLAYLVFASKRAASNQQVDFGTRRTALQAAGGESVTTEPSWTVARIEEALGEIDWYQYEKFCAALLRAEGYAVQRKGGAQPDGGVDLVAAKEGESMLVQCKHWRTWTVQERVIRELLGSMTHYQVKRGAIYVLKGATRPAAAFALQHNIHVVDGKALAARASRKLSRPELTTLLSSREHHCPKCESPMVWRTGDFTAFWGCSTYPRCRATLKQPGAK